MVETVYQNEENEEKEILEEAEKLREIVGGEFRQKFLPSVRLESKTEPSSFVSLGRSLLATFNSVNENKLLVRNVFFYFSV